MNLQSRVGETLTGRRRHRSGWFGRLVLQVEVTGFSFCSDDMSEGPAYTRWRDATVIDMETTF